MRLRHNPAAREEIAVSPLVFDTEAAISMRGRWRSEGDCPLVLEIGMGRGSFITAHALQEPEKIFLGLEFREEMVLEALTCLKRLKAVKGQHNDPKNLKMLWTNAQFLTEIFAPGELTELLLNFSDPWPKARHAKRRLTHQLFWNQYRQILQPGGLIRLRTDNKDFFDWSLSSMSASCFKLLLRTEAAPLPPDGIISEYERRYRHREQPIYAADWQLLD